MSGGFSQNAAASRVESRRNSCWDCILEARTFLFCLIGGFFSRLGEVENTYMVCTFAFSLLSPAYIVLRGQLYSFVLGMHCLSQIPFNKRARKISWWDPYFQHSTDVVEVEG